MKTWLNKVKRELLTKGGVHPRPMKVAATFKIFPGPYPEQVTIPLQQHVGAPCVPLVEKGDRVLVGQKIGDSEAYVSAPVHSSVSGEVTAILEHPHPTGKDVLSVQIKSDGLFITDPDIGSPGDPVNMTPDEIRAVIREGGIVGLGGAGFPTHVKLAPPSDKPIDLVIINGAECEPYLTGDHRLMVERSDEIIDGACIIRKVVGAGSIVVAIESNKPDARASVEEAARRRGVDLEVALLPTLYPQGAEKTLIKGITGKEVPSGGLPMDVGVVVNNVGTAAAISDVFNSGIPLVERVLTVGGDGVAAHANLRIRIGTHVGDVIDFCGGFSGTKGKLILGGPMMGLAQYTTEVPVIKGTSGIIVLSGETVFTREPHHFVCIRCGKCVRRCPMKLTPDQMAMYSDRNMWDKLEDLNIKDCVECGCCSYVCPTKNPLVQMIKLGKEGLARHQKKMEEAEARNEG